MNLGPAEMMDFGLGEYMAKNPRNAIQYIPEETLEKYGQKSPTLTITLTNYAGVEATARAAIEAGSLPQRHSGGTFMFGGVLCGIHV